MDGILKIIVSVVILVAGTVILRAFRSAKSTTLTTAWVWSVVAGAAWTVTWLVDPCLKAVSAEFADHAWYASAVLCLCPPIAVLGSRRPGTRVWAWFILVPMLLAMGWPVGTLWLQGSELRGLQLETPQVIAFCLVLVMGVGNYCGTRFTIPVLLYGAATAALVVSSSIIAPVWLSDRTETRFWSTVVMLLAVCQTKTSSRPTAASRFDRLWFDFFDQFGIVWGRRIQDRVNFIVQKEHLPVRLELEGFVWTPTSDSGSSNVDDLQQTAADDARERAVELRLEHLLRWLLRRFVDPVWIDRRLGSNSQSNANDISVDS